jgi:hypothetical protein
VDLHLPARHFDPGQTEPPELARLEQCPRILRLMSTSDSRDSAKAWMRALQTRRPAAASCIQHAGYHRLQPVTRPVQTTTSQAITVALSVLRSWWARSISSSTRSNGVAPGHLGQIDVAQRALSSDHYSGTPFP